jgi:hypothetical protein
LVGRIPLTADFCYVKNPFSKLIFTDSTGFVTELAYDTTRRSSSIYASVSICETSPSSFQVTTWKSEFISIELVDSMTNDRWSFSLSNNLKPDIGPPYQSDHVFKVKYREKGKNSFLQLYNMNLTTNQNPTFSIDYFKSIELNSKVFDDVFYRKVYYNRNPLELYFNFEYGLIAYTSIDGERLMILDRIE